MASSNDKKILMQQIETADVQLKPTPNSSDSTSINNILRLQGEIQSEKAKASLKNIPEPSSSSFSQRVKVQGGIISGKRKQSLKHVPEPADSQFSQIVKLQGAVKKGTELKHVKEPENAMSLSNILKLQCEIKDDKSKNSLKHVETPATDFGVQRAKLDTEIKSENSKANLKSVPAPEDAKFSKIVKLQGDIRKGAQLKPVVERSEM